jgi:7-cyano-7-deazaguanine synthase
MSDATGLVLVSGGIDSSVCLALAARHGRSPIGVAFDYGQHNRAELVAAERIADALSCELLVVAIDLGTAGHSPLTGAAFSDRPPDEATPATYVAGRNLVFLSIAMGIAETREIQVVYFGPTAHDSKYPDCRREFVEAFERSANLGLQCARAGRPISIRTPLIGFSKADILRAALRLEVPLHLTWSCYRDLADPCMNCGACRLRARGFAEAGIDDPASAG